MYKFVSQNITSRREKMYIEKNKYVLIIQLLVIVVITNNGASATPVKI